MNDELWGCDSEKNAKGCKKITVLHYFYTLVIEVGNKRLVNQMLTVLYAEYKMSCKTP
ncbi:MAG: hypothetical protein K8953_00415 [Proteobacteria bacterium]|nr:hypothetical protein [Pseudomonadota bacterium]